MISIYNLYLKHFNYFAKPAQLDAQITLWIITKQVILYGGGGARVSNNKP